MDPWGCLELQECALGVGSCGKGGPRCDRLEAAKFPLPASYHIAAHPLQDRMAISLQVINLRWSRCSCETMPPPRKLWLPAARDTWAVVDSSALELPASARVHLPKIIKA